MPAVCSLHPIPIASARTRGRLYRGSLAKGIGIGKRWLTGLLVVGMVVLPVAGQAVENGPFFRAIFQDNASAMQRLLDDCVSANLKNDRGIPGLYLALQEDSLDVARVLVDAPDLQAEQRNDSDESLLMMAAFKGNLDISRRLIERGAQINKDGWTPLHYAATNGHVDVMELLIHEHARVNARSPNGSTPLMLAASYGSPQAVDLLLRHGANPDLTNELGVTALDFARRAKQTDSERLLEQAERVQPAARP